MMAGIGLWIGWGQVRIDTRRGVVERRPIGLPLFARTRPISTANRLYVGFYRTPTAVATPSAGIRYGGGDGTPLWYVRFEGNGYQFMLIVQRAREEAIAFAESLAAKFDLPVEILEEPS